MAFPPPTLRIKEYVYTDLKAEVETAQELYDSFIEGYGGLPASSSLLESMRYSMLPVTGYPGFLHSGIYLNEGKVVYVLDKVSQLLGLVPNVASLFYMDPESYIELSDTFRKSIYKTEDEYRFSQGDREGLLSNLSVAVDLADGKVVNKGLNQSYCSFMFTGFSSVSVNRDIAARVSEVTVRGFSGYPITHLYRLLQLLSF